MGGAEAGAVNVQETFKYTSARSGATSGRTRLPCTRRALVTRPQHRMGRPPTNTHRWR
jgi:hypothetical protein